jgi:protein arginine kinase activator
MICDICNEREATIEFTAVTGDEKKTLHLCGQCSKQESKKQAVPTKVSPTHVKASKKVNIVIGHLAGTEVGKGSCSGCGMTYEEFRKVGRLGCSQCYEAFGTPLRRLLKRIHGSDTHVGRGPRSPRAAGPPGATGKGGQPQSLEELREALQTAVDTEEYERAAQLRDRIRLQENTR